MRRDLLQRDSESVSSLRLARRAMQAIVTRMIAWREWLAFANEGGIYSQSIGIECTVCTALSPFFVRTSQIFPKWVGLTANLRSQLHNGLDHRLCKIW